MKCYTIQNKVVYTDAIKNVVIKPCNGCAVSHLLRGFLLEKVMEIYRDIDNYKDYYQISNFGNARSVDRVIKHKNGKVFKYKGKYLKAYIDSTGYPAVTLCVNQKTKSTRIHILVWDAFGDNARNEHILQVDHIDENKLNNKIDNLQLLTPRGNTTKYRATQKSTSPYLGVSFKKELGKWFASATLSQGKGVYLGIYVCEVDAYFAYRNFWHNRERGVL